MFISFHFSYLNYLNFIVFGWSIYFSIFLYYIFFIYNEYYFNLNFSNNHYLNIFRGCYYFLYIFLLYIIKYVFILSKYTYLYIDKGILEYIGPYGLVKFINVITKKLIILSSSLLYHYLGMILISFSFILFILNYYII